MESVENDLNTKNMMYMLCKCLADTSYKYLYDLKNPGKIIKVECTNHSYAWSGKMPCTGTYRCIHCGKEKENVSAC